MKENKYNISVVVPVYNSEECLNELYSQIQIALADFKAQIIFVNDGSSDRSWHILSEIAAENKNVISINLSKNFGQNNAILAGLKFSEGEYTVIMDDDLQHDPKDIPLLIAECKKGFDVCFALFENLNQKGWKNSGSKFNGKIAEWFIGKPKNIYLSPFKAIHFSVINRIKNFKGSYPYIDVMILQTTNSFSQLKVNHHSRFKGKGNYTFRKSLVVFFSHLFSYSVFPLKLITRIGVISVLFSFAAGMYYLWEYMYGTHRVEGWVTLALLILFFGGMILFSLGIVGSYISRMYQDKNYEEPFSVREVKNFK